MSVGEYEGSLRERYLDAKRRLAKRGAFVPAEVVENKTTRVIVHRTVTGTHRERLPKVPLVQRVIRKRFPMETMNSVIMRISRARDVPPLLVAGHCRMKDVVAARYEVFSVLNASGLSIERIGKAFGKDHTTVLYGIRRHRGMSSREIKPGKNGKGT